MAEEVKKFNNILPSYLALAKTKIRFTKKAIIILLGQY